MVNSSVIMNHVEDFGLPVCKAVSLDDWCPIFQSILVLSCGRINQSHHCDDLKSCVGNVFGVVFWI